MVRAPCFDKYGIKKGAWSQDEDNKLRDYIQRYGHSNWRQLPKLAGLSRCGKSCRLRWMNYLRPNVKRGNFTKDEEDVIVGLHNKIGNKWSTIATRLPGRSDNEIKNHWHTHLKTRSRKDQTVLKSEQVENNLEPKKVYPKANKSKIFLNPNNLEPNLRQQEVEILLAVLSSKVPSSSSTSESSPCSLSVSDYAVPRDVTPQCSELAREQFLPDNGSIISSSDNMFSPMGLVDDLISQASFQDYIMDDVLLWSNLNLYF